MTRPHVLVGHWGVTGVTAAQGLALLAPVGVALLQGGALKAMMLIAAVVVVLIWELLFALLRNRRVSFHGLTVAVIVAVLSPALLPLWQLAIALSLGLVLGELVFGGRGFGFVAPATVTLSVLVVSFPQAGLAPVSAQIALATVPGALFLLYLGLMSWRVVVGVMLALLALQGLSLDPIAVATALSFGLVFLACDPVAAASTNPGRWLYGALTGLLIALFSAGNGAITTEALVFAALLSSIFAPLIDHLVVLADAARRRRRFG